MFKDVRLANRGNPGVEKFGLSEKARMKIYANHSPTIGRRSDSDARARYPKPFADLKSRIAYTDELIKIYRANYAATHGISVDQLWEIVTEGFENEWPDY